MVAGPQGAAAETTCSRLDRCSSAEISGLCARKDTSGGARCRKVGCK